MKGDNVKFTDRLQAYDYIIGVDLAFYNSGLCIYNIHTHTIDKTIQIEVLKNSKYPILDLYDKIYSCLSNLKKELKGSFFLVKERMPQQAGRCSTISVLQQLAKAHAVLDLCLAQQHIPSYDEFGIHASSIKSVFRSEECPKPSKKDIACLIGKYYQLDIFYLSEDITDSIAVIHTLLVKKWNTDIDMEIKEIKKQIKKLKADKIILAKQKEIERLLNIKIEQ